MDKRGESDLLWNVIQAVLIISVVVFIFYWINDASSGKLIQAQADAKSSALIADAMRPGTDLIIDKNISLTNNNFNAEFGGRSFSYSTFNPKISLQKTAEGAEVKA